jgi:hypothetical protein
MSSMTTLPETPVCQRLRRREAKAERKGLESPQSATLPQMVPQVPFSPYHHGQKYFNEGDFPKQDVAMTPRLL